MLFNFNKLLFLIMLFMSILLVMSSENWVSLWMSMEINMMMFMSIIIKKYNNKSSESMMIYFLIQSMGSMMFIYSIFMNKMSININMNINMYYFILLMSLMLKIGTVPFHFWLVLMMNKMSWYNNIFLMTIQKIIPLIIIQMIMNKMIILMAMASVIVGAIGGINQTSMKKMMSFSSINHMGWMMMSMIIENELWIKYFIIYSIMVIFMIMMFKNMMIIHINQMNLMTNTYTKINIIIMMMSMGGLPPMLGFFPKWMIINKLINMNMIMPTMIMLMMSMLTLYYYMRISIPFMMIKSMNNKWTKNKFSMNIYMIMINMILPITIMMI